MTVDGFVFQVERLFMNPETPYVDLYRERRGRLELITFTYPRRVMSSIRENNGIRNASGVHHDRLIVIICQNKNYENYK